MDAIQLRFRGEVIREVSLGERALEVGRAPYCDIVVHDPCVAERVFVVQAEGGTVVAYDLRGNPRRPKRRLFPREYPIPVGENHALIRVDAPPPLRVSRRGDEGEPRTEGLGIAPLVSCEFMLVVGRGRDARRYPITRAPLGVGSAPENVVVLNDRTVSARHLRLESTSAGVAVCDLGSRNGTFVDGVRAHRVDVARAVTVRVGRTELRIEPVSALPGERIVAVSRELRDAVALVDRVALLPFPVLLLGESGVGKEALARRVHDGSARSKGPFVSLNAAGLSPELVESTLFGHERGAFTGATTRHRGVFHQADTGTLFLDEVGELPLELQSRMLRVLETMEVRRVGAEKAERVDVRVVCATHRALALMVARGEFRQDLYYRLAQLQVEVPPLRSRPDDIVPTALHVLATESRSLGPRTLSPGARAALVAHRWFGNVRELRNVLIEAAASTTASVIELEHVAGVFARASRAAETTTTLHDFRHALAIHHGNVTAAARALDMPRSTLRDWAKREAAAASSTTDACGKTAPLPKPRNLRARLGH
jgi:DNA-binding NtrC family response regulator